MSIEISRARVAGAIIACECAMAALGKAIRLVEEAQRDLAAELKFGNDSATPEGQQLTSFSGELDAFMSAMLGADLVSPHCGDAMQALKVIAAKPATLPASMRPTGAAALNLARSVA